MSVNVSAGRLVDPELADRIADDVAESGFDPVVADPRDHRERGAHRDEATVRNLAALRALGVRIALDDFGTGFSSLSHLDRLQVDIVKIDKSFVQALGTQDDTRSMAAAMIQLARTLGYDTIAEGVETAAQEASLRGWAAAWRRGTSSAARWTASAAALAPSVPAAPPPTMGRRSPHLMTTDGRRR